ncbi:sulfite exporter TauE/SafE family protein [Myxococcota bacterium]|nr:sulfite exporter TauE/SafE family protein [Myxococcota bacterium]
MPALEASVVSFLFSIAAGCLGALLGLGGGIIVVPVLTLVLGIDIRHAIAASLVSIIATSSGAAAAYVRDGLANLRVAFFLEIGTVAGSMIGASLAGWLPAATLQGLFGGLLAATAVLMLRNRAPRDAPVPPDPLADRLGLHGSVRDPATGRETPYRVTRSPLGLVLMVLAGILSGLLGVGAGILKVPALDLGMRLPIKVSSATSNLMIGVTAAAGAGVWLARGDVRPMIAAPVATGVLLGAMIGARLLPHVPSLWLRRVFVAVLLWVSGQMIWRAFA